MSVLLGFKDERVKKNEIIDWSVNKLGGLPDWMSCFSASVHPKCKACNRFLYQITQVYCPLVGSSYNRTLHVFGCRNRECWDKPESFTVLRCQKIEEEEAPPQSIPVSTDSWGTNEWFDDDSEADIGTGIVAQEEVSDKSSNLQNNVDVDAIAKSLSHNLCITDASHPPPPAFIPFHIFVMNEKDIAVESEMDYEFQLYQDYIAREGDLAESVTASGGEETGKGGRQKENKDRNEFGDQYSKVTVKHGDKLFHQFQKRIKHSPTQCLRYNWKGEPLLLSNVSPIFPPLNAIPPCRSCQSPRVFELQLMPNLTRCIHATSAEAIEVNGNEIVFDRLPFTDTNDLDTLIDFGCLYIYTCSQSCWRDGDDVILEEHIAIQGDPESNLFR